MPRSAALRTADLRAVFRLAGECRELGDDPLCWRRHLVAGLARLVGGGFWVAGEFADRPGGGRQDLGAVDWGGGNGFDRAGWVRMLDAFHDDPFSNPIVNAYAARPGGPAGAGLTRADLIPDRAWYASAYYQRLHRVLGADATLACLLPVPGTAAEYCEVYALRAAGEKDFSPRDRAVVRELMAAVGPLVGGRLPGSRSPPRAPSRPSGGGCCGACWRAIRTSRSGSASASRGTP